MGIFSSLLGNAGYLDQQKAENEVGQLLIEDEKIDIGFIVFRDMFIFTSLRLILIDKQGLTGQKIEYKSIPYKAITRFSVETVGSFDLDAELKIWVGSESSPSVSKKFNKNVNVYEVQKMLGHYIL